MLSKVDLSVIAALAAGCAFWIEQGQRVIIDAPTPSELAAAAACSDSDNVPYTANCLLFMSGPYGQAKEAEDAATQLQAARSTEDLFAGAAPCPDRDNVPYSASCLTYLQGATTTGMRWRIRAPAMPAPLNAPTPVAAAIGASEKR